MFRAAFSIVRAVLEQQNNVFTPNLSVEFEIILKMSAKNVMKISNEMSQFGYNCSNVTIVLKIYI